MKRSSKRSNKLNKFSLGIFREHKKLSVFLGLSIVFLSSFFVINYGRYVKDVVQIYYLRSKDFYFTSDKLTASGKKYEINPWGGTSPYGISISMSSLLNSLKGANSDIYYDLSCSTDGKVTCNIEGNTKVKRTILSSTHVDNFIVNVNPISGVNLKDGDKVTVSVKAISTSPYVEELSADFTLVIGNYGVNYEIEDKKNNIYMDSIVTNTLDTKTVNVSLDITSDAVVMDMNNHILETKDVIIQTRDGKNFSDITNNIPDKNYKFVKKITFSVGPKSSVRVRYFKQDPSENYSYPDVNVKPIVQFKRN